MGVLLVQSLISARLKAYGIDYAALFDGSTGYLNRMPSVQGDRRTFTVSFWTHRSSFGSQQTILSARPSTNYSSFQFRSDDNKFEFVDGNVGYGQKAGNVFRDLTGWMHIVYWVDTTATDAADRSGIFINGVEGTDYVSGGTVLGLNVETEINTTYEHTIGKFLYLNSGYLDAYLADLYFVDGQALHPDHFGQLDSKTGNWIAKKRDVSKLDLGPNGFYLDFSNPNDLGKSGVRTSGDVAAILNPLTPHSYCTLQNANRTWYGNSGVNSSQVPLILGCKTSGKEYIEMDVDALDGSGNTYPRWGIVSKNEISSSSSWNGNGNMPGYTTSSPHGFGVWADGDIRSNTTVTHNFASWTGGSTRVAIALDHDNGAAYVRDNGVWLNSGDPESGVSRTGAVYTWTPGEEWYVILSGFSASKSTVRVTEAEWVDAAPVGYSAITADNLPTPAGKLSDHFRTVLYTGNGTAIGSGGNTVSTGFDQVDFAWVKDRDNIRGHALFDTARGDLNRLNSSTTNAEENNAELASFSMGDLLLGSDTAVNASGQKYVLWCTNLPNTKTSGWSGSPSITPSKEIYNAELGMSIVTYTGNGTSGATIPHSLGNKPGMVIVKSRSLGSLAEGWPIYHSALGATKYLALQNVASSVASLSMWNDTEPTSSLVTLGDASAVNSNSETYVAYIFTETDFCKIGSYTGNGSTDGPFINLRGKPVWMLDKRSSDTGYWCMRDQMRSPYNPSDLLLRTEDSGAEFGSGGTYSPVDIVANGAKNRCDSNANYSNATGTHIYLAFVEPAQTSMKEGNHWQTNGTITQVTSTPTNTGPSFTAAGGTITPKSDGTGINYSHGTASWTNECISNLVMHENTGLYKILFKQTVATTGSSYPLCSLGSIGYQDVTNANHYFDNAVVFDPPYGQTSVISRYLDGVWTQGYFGTLASTPVNGDELEFLVDTDNDTITIYENGNLITNAMTMGFPYPLAFVAKAYNSQCDVIWDFTASDAAWNANGTEWTTNRYPKQTGKLSDHWATVLYDGTSSAQSVATGLPSTDFVWLKSRTSVNSHQVMDAIRGAGQSIKTNATDAEVDESANFTAFTANGFDLAGITNAFNNSSHDYVAFCASLPNTKTSGWSGSPSITPSKEIYNATLGMSVVSFTGNGTSGATIPHSLGKKPGLVIVRRVDAVSGWEVYHTALGATKYMQLNTTGQAYTDPADWNDTEPTNMLVTLGNGGNVNTNNAEHIAYIFAETDFCKIGSVEGNSSTDGPFVNLGGTPEWVLSKNIDNGTSGAHWLISDCVRNPYNPVDRYLYTETSSMELYDPGVYDTDFCSNGIKQRTSNFAWNGDTHIYLAFVNPNSPTENTAR